MAETVAQLCERLKRDAGLLELRTLNREERKEIDQEAVVYAIDRLRTVMVGTGS